MKLSNDYAVGTLTAEKSRFLSRDFSAFPGYYPRDTKADLYPAAASLDTLRDVALHWRYTVVQYSLEARALLLHTRVRVFFTIEYLPRAV